jgi:hypothetical protein
VSRTGTGLLIAVVTVASLQAASGCDDGGGYEQRAGPRVPDSLARELPTLQLALAGDFCPEEGGLRGARLERELERARAKLSALAMAFEINPDALVKTRWISADGPGGSEDLTVRELAEDQLTGAREFPVKSLPRPCQPRTRRLQRTLENLLEGV